MRLIMVLLMLLGTLVPKSASASTTGPPAMEAVDTAEHSQATATDSMTTNIEVFEVECVGSISQPALISSENVNHLEEISVLGFFYKQDLATCSDLASGAIFPSSEVTVLVLPNMAVGHKEALPKEKWQAKVKGRTSPAKFWTDSG